MRYYQAIARKNLCPRWGGSFAIVGLGGDYGESGKIQQLNGIPIPRAYYGGHLKVFKPRMEYFQSNSD